MIGREDLASVDISAGAAGRGNEPREVLAWLGRRGRTTAELAALLDGIGRRDLTELLQP